MKQVRQVLITGLVFLLITGIPVCAAEPDAIYTHNQELAAQWANWRPAVRERNAEVQALASRLLREAGSRKAAPRRIYDWVRAGIAYDWDALEQEIYSALLPSEVLHRRKAVCEGIANLTQALFLEAGIPCIKVWGVTITDEMEWSGSGPDLTRANHTWNEFYMDGRWITMDCTMDIINNTSACFDPDETFFARTHMRLRRGDDPPENRPSAGVLPDITRAVDAGLVSLDWLSDYRRAVTAAEWFELTGLGEKQDIPLTRLTAAASLARLLPETDGVPPYSDMDGRTAEERRILAALYGAGIMTGCDGRFFPDGPLTRQAAIAVLWRLHNQLEG